MHGMREIKLRMFELTKTNKGMKDIAMDALRTARNEVVRATGDANMAVIYDDAMNRIYHARSDMDKCFLGCFMETCTLFGGMAKITKNALRQAAEADTEESWYAYAMLAQIEQQEGAYAEKRLTAKEARETLMRNGFCRDFLCMTAPVLRKKVENESTDDEIAKAINEIANNMEFAMM